MADSPRIKLPYGRQSVSEADIGAVCDVLRDDWITQGPRIAAFERAVADRVSADHGVAVSSGTAALHSACLAAGLGEGDEVVVPTLTFAATAAAVRLAGAEVRLADIDPDTLGLSADTAAAVASSKNKAIIPVDFAGLPCDWAELNDFAKDRRLITIADAAHALGALYQGQPVGSLADMTCFSFHPVKVVTTAEGGMIVTDNAEHAANLRSIRSHGIIREADKFTAADPTRIDDEPWYYEVQSIGLNYRISDLQCALGLSQMDRLSGFLERRLSIASEYQRAFATTDLIRSKPTFSDRVSAWHLYTIELNLEALEWSRAQVFAHLRQCGLGVQVHYIPLHRHPYYRARYGVTLSAFPNAERYYESAISLPLFPDMADTDVEYVVDTVLDTLAQARR